MTARKRKVTPADYNLLELYRQHRDEIDSITDPTSLFILAFTNQLGKSAVDELAGDLGIPPKNVRAKLTPLLRAQLMIEAKDSLTVTPLGKLVLEELGFFTPPAPPSERPKDSEPPKQPPKAPTQVPGSPDWLWGVIAFLGTGAVVLTGIILVGIYILPDWLNPPIPTITPRIATSAPVAPTLAPRPEVQIEFVAERTRLEPGECTMLHWQVVGGFGVTLSNKSVERAGSTQVCPRESTAYELAVDAGDTMKRSTVVIAVASVVVPEPTRTFTPTPTRTPTLTPTRTRTRTPTPTRTPAPVTIQLTPVADAFVVRGCPSANYDGDTLAVASQYGDPDCGQTARSLLRFNLAALPPDQIIQSATLYAYLQSGTPGSTTIRVYASLDGWSETTVNWNNRPSPSAGFYDATLVGGSGWYSWNVTLLLLEWYKGNSPNYGLILMNANEASSEYNYRVFRSREHSVSTSRPFLRITYQP